MAFNSVKLNIKPQSGKVTLCTFCGEQVGNSQKYCPTCKLKGGREQVRNDNMDTWIKQGMDPARAGELMPGRGYESNIS